MPVLSIVLQPASRYCVGRISGSRNIKRETSSWIAEYLSSTPTYGDALLRRRFGLPKKLFDEIVEELQAAYPSRWCTLVTAAGKCGISAEVKVLPYLRMLTKSRIMDDLEDSARMAEETVIVRIKLYLKDMISQYCANVYNRRPTGAKLES